MLIPHKRFLLSRLRARVKRRLRGGVSVDCPRRLHLGCGGRIFPGWLNVDVKDSDYDLDVTDLPLPWADDFFQAVVSQHLIEHLELHSELIPLLKELRRVVAGAGEVWLSCPDMAKVCGSYVADQGASMLASRLRRMPRFTLNGAPTQQMINDLFHQHGEHRNLFDYDLLAWALKQAGFASCERMDESRLRGTYPEIPLRDDDDISLYVRAKAHADGTRPEQRH